MRKTDGKTAEEKSAVRARRKARRAERKRRSLRNKRFFAPFNPEGKSWKIRLLLWVVTAAMLVFSGIGMGIMNLYFGTGRYKLELLEFYFESRKLLVVLNVLPFVVLILFLWLLTNRAWISFLLTGVFTLVYSWSEYWKLMARSDPVIAEDLTIIKEGAQMGVNYVMITWQIVLSAVLVLVGTLIFFFFLRGCFSRRWVGLCLSVMPVAISFLLYTRVYMDNELYNSFPCWNKLNKWIDSNQFISRGCMYPFLNSVQRAASTPPKGYTQEAAISALKQFDTDPIPEERKVNVMVIMGEAFSDLSICTDKITGEDPYASYHALRDESLHGALVTNIFAGGTINTERCMLTGFPFLSNFRRASWSYARYFGDQGYALNGSHPGYEAFYNRISVNENLGISNYYFLENHYGKVEGHIAPDRVLFPEILRLCREDLEQSDWVFSFNVTYQNHGPYSASEENFTEVYVPADAVDHASYVIVNNYLSGVKDTGEQLKALSDELKQDDAPWVLIFFGDHKPWLGDQDSVYAALDIDLTSSSIESYYNYYNTEYLIWANDAAKERVGADFSGEGPKISPCYLMNLLFAECGWDGPSFLKFSNQTMELLPLIMKNGSFIVDDKVVWGESLTEEARQAANMMHYVTYYLMRDSGGRLPAAN